MRDHSAYNTIVWKETNGQKCDTCQVSSEIFAQIYMKNSME